MKINSEYQNQINQSQESTQKKKPAEEFSRMLDQELSRSTGAGQGEKASNTARADMLHPAQLLGNSILTQQKQEPSFMNQMDDLLSKWENYAAEMNSPESSLKEIYGHLEHILEGVREMKDSKSFEDQRPELRSLVEELEVLATAEVVKINRGDYLA
ncbi:conserved hypothetical protein [Desulfonatronospira thiodismutans ASO3-1]|uniref:Uncharacterized protein n=1 Tax=Desulfonatronospira thiodismutans ASO3-1 TaxID=555779 RepID=D6SRN2_9BACT|nr:MULTISPECIES: hypothetical protein [Desulfonatronospira]EFI33348.1 conserved hypothetical protein [Desulfonatronospira thiodismutans ASO3-1]RQD75880.1 MAG: hypothetical protein D5S03_07465 [Desulfonatronospira sp. MSAO_Bac3]